MSHLYTVRTGWEGERLAHYLLSRFSFVAQPTTIADDVGADFYCTIFDIVESNPPMVEARTSFAIQVKSNADKVEAHNKVRYLQHLEMPFFLGIVDQTAAELSIYSAEYFPMMTAVYGFPEKLWLRPVESCDPRRPYEGLSAQAGVTLDCYRVCSFTASESRDQIRPKVGHLLKLCRRAVNNIGTRRVEEHIYQLDDAGTQFSIVAGCGSINYFRDNMCIRLAEAFYNFEYMLRSEPEKFALAEFQIYEKFYLALAASYGRPMLGLAHDMYCRIKTMLAQSGA